MTNTVGIFEQREEDLTVGMGAHGGGDLPLELIDLSDQRLERRDQAEHELPARVQLRFADPAFGRASELREQLRGFLGAGVMLACEERREALLSEALRVDRARVALKERERDRAVELREQADRAGPETCKL